MVVVRGDAVFGGEVAGSCSVGVPVPGSVYFCSELTVAEVRRALDAGVVAILTAKGDFASHAANLLRNARGHGDPIVWVRGLVVERATEVSISSDGTCVFDEAAALSVLAKHGGTPSTFRYQRGQSSWNAVCLWPERVYQDDEFTLAKAGLEQGASELAATHVNSTRWRGRLWFDAPALTNAQLLEFALDRRKSVPYLERMANDYSMLVAHMSRGDSSRDIPFTFFSTLLPFHKSYGAVMRRMLAGYPNEFRVAVDAALTNGVVKWLDGRPEFSASTKVAGDPLWDGLLPPNSVGDYIVETEQHIAQVAPSIAKDVIHWLALVAVVKEFKMVISKNIYARYLPRRGD